MSMGLTPVQSNCMALLRDHLDMTGSPPSFREIAECLGFKSLSRVHSLLESLEDRGVIRRLPKQARAIEIVDQSETRSVTIPANVWALLVGYCVKEQVSVETAVAQFVRDGIEGA